jgi:hypothetical protein
LRDASAGVVRNGKFSLLEFERRALRVAVQIKAAYKRTLAFLKGLSDSLVRFYNYCIGVLLFFTQVQAVDQKGTGGLSHFAGQEASAKKKMNLRFRTPDRQTLTLWTFLKISN